MCKVFYSSIRWACFISSMCLFCQSLIFDSQKEADGFSNFFLLESWYFFRFQRKQGYLTKQMETVRGVLQEKQRTKAVILAQLQAKVREKEKSEQI